MKTQNKSLRVLVDAMESLSARQMDEFLASATHPTNRLIVAMAYDGKQIEDIAKAVGITEGSIQSRTATLVRLAHAITAGGGGFTSDNGRLYVRPPEKRRNWTGRVEEPLPKEQKEPTIPETEKEPEEATVEQIDYQKLTDMVIEKLAEKLSRQLVNKFLSL